MLKLSDACKPVVSLTFQVCENINIYVMARIEPRWQAATCDCYVWLC